MEGFQAQGKGNADKNFSTIHLDQGGDTIRKLSQQTDNLLAVICLLQNQFEAVKRDVEGIKENVAKLGPRDDGRECTRKSKKQVLPHALRPEACTSLTDPTDPPLTEKDPPELRAVWPCGKLEPVQEKSQLYGQVEESDSSRRFHFSTNVPVFGASSNQRERTSDSRAEASPSVEQKWRESQSGRKIETSSESKNMMQLAIKPEPASVHSNSASTVHSNSASSECKTENVFDELVNLKNEFQEWRVASSLIPAQLRLEMRHLASAQKEQEQKIDDLRRFLNLQTHSSIVQQKLLLEEMKSLSQKQTSFSDDLSGMEEKIRANQGWNDYEELLGGMSQQNEDICEIMTYVGKQIKELKVSVKEQSSWSWRCDTCMATNPLKVGSSQKLIPTSAGAFLLSPPVTVGERSGEDQLYDPHDDPSISLLESLDLTTAGDEGEEVIFKARGKLFHYDSNIKAWQEVCVGEVKILKNLEIGRARLLMKTEKIRKICANHWLKPDMQLLPMNSSDSAWAWDAVDFAKGEKFHERFSLEFQTQDLAAEFRKIFDKMKQWTEKSSEKVEPVKAGEPVLLKDKSSGHSVNSTNSYGLRKKLGVQEEDDLDDVVEDSDDDSDENQPQRQEKSSMADSVFEVPTAKSSSHLIKSPAPASQSLASHLASTKLTVTTQSLPACQFLASHLASSKPTVTTQSPAPSEPPAFHVASSKSTQTTQSPFAGISFNKTPGILTSFASSQTFQIPQATAPVTTTSSSSSFAGFSCQTTQSKKGASSLFGSNTSSTQLVSSKPTVTTQSPAPSQSPAFYMASSKSTQTTQSPLVGISFNKIPGISTSFASSQTFQIPQAAAPVTTTSSSSSFAGFSFQTTQSKKGAPSLFGSNTSSTQLASSKPTVTTQSPAPSQSPGFHMASSKSTQTTQSPLVGTSFNKTPGTSSSFASSQTFQIPQAPAPVTTTSSSSGFAGFSFQTTQSKKGAPSLFGSNTSSTQLASSKPTVTTQSSAPSQSPGFHVASSKSTQTTQSPLVGTSFNKTPGTSTSFASSQTFQIPQATAPVTTTSSSSSFAGFSFQTVPSKKDTPALFGSNTSSQSSKDNSAAQQYPQLTALLVGGPNEEEEGTAESPRPGFCAPSESCETLQSKAGQSPMGVTSSVTQKEDKPSTTPLKGKDDNCDNDDVIFMGEVKATPEQVAKAEKLMLSPNFYLYEQRPPCPGCRGCDEEDLKAKTEGNKPIVVEQKSSSLFLKKPTVSEQATQPPPTFFGNAAISSLSFAALSADGDASFAIKDTSTKPFQFAGAGAGARVFGSTHQDHDNVAEDQEYDPHYDPIISLPENVDLTTGDEGQEVVFRERAKLYRYDGDTQTWKERGVGDMKILVNPETGKARILMRREQVLKVCANHWLKPDMQLLPMSSSDRAFVWNAIDFAEGEECHEKFALKFKTPELAAEFKRTFDEMKEGVKPSLTKLVEPVKEKPAEPVEEVKPAASLGEDDSGHRFHQADPLVAHLEEEEEDDYDKYDGEYEGEEDGYEDEEDYYEDEDGDDEYEDYDDEEEEEYVEDGYPEEPSLADQFKPTPGSWDCDTCMVNNPPDKNQCLACATAKPGATSQPSKGSSETQPSLSEMFKPASGSWACDSCMINNPADKVQCVACSTPKPGSSQPSQGTSGDSQGTPGGMGMSGEAFSLGNFKFSGFSSNPSAFSAGSGFGSSGFNKSTPGTFSFGQTPSQSSNTTPSSSDGFSLPRGGFSFTQPKPETSQPSDSGGFKMPAASSSSCTAPTPPIPESTKSAADLTTKEQPLSKTTESPSGQQTKTPTFNFGAGMPQSTFDVTNLQKPTGSGFSLGSTPGSCAQQTVTTPAINFGSGMPQSTFYGTNQKKPISAFSFGSAPGSSAQQKITAPKFNFGSGIPQSTFDGAKQQKPLSLSSDLGSTPGSSAQQAITTPTFNFGYRMPQFTSDGTNQKKPSSGFSFCSTPGGSAQQTVKTPTFNFGSRTSQSTSDSTNQKKPSSGFSFGSTTGSTSQQTITPTFNFGSGKDQSTFEGGTNQQNLISGVSFGSPPGSSAPTSQAASTPPSSTTSWPGSVFEATQVTATVGATREKGSPCSFTGFEFGTKQSEPKTEQKEAISISDLVKNKRGFSFHLNAVTSSPSESGTKSPVKSPGLNNSREYYQEEERDDIYFEPVVTLPENFKLETGEENEKIKFSQRAKLYRFDVEGSQWKDRGVGDIKVLYNPETKQHRIVMRRDQVLKVCANHYITQHVNLQPNKGSDRSWVWQAMDSSDGDPQNEQLAVRFKTEVAAREFKEVVDEAKKNLPGTSNQPVEPVGKSETKKNLVPAVSDKTEGGDVGRDKLEAEDCEREKQETGDVARDRLETGDVGRDKLDEDADGTVNEDDVKDVSDKQKGDDEPSKAADEETSKEEKEKNGSMEVKFSAPADLSYADENKEWKPRGKGQFQILFDKDDKNYSVEMRRDEDNSLCAKHPITKAIQLMPVRGQDRSYAWSAMNSLDKEGPPVPMTFSVRFKNRETANTFQEEFQKAQILVLRPLQLESSAVVYSPPADEENSKEEKEENSSIVVKFSAPADLSYADENKEWKLRGKGQFQILFDKESKNSLVEMRRYEDNSLCAKHPITQAIQLMPVRGQDRSYAWSALDSSDKEGSPVPMTFAVRFKNRETADNFKEEFQKAQTLVLWPRQLES